MYRGGFFLTKFIDFIQPQKSTFKNRIIKQIIQ